MLRNFIVFIITLLPSELLVLALRKKHDIAAVSVMRWDDVLNVFENVVPQDETH